MERYSEYKDSGVQWLGEIPKGWECVRVKSLFSNIREKNNPIQTEERLSLSIGKGVTLYSEKTTNLDRFKEDCSQYLLAYPNDIVLNSMNMIVGAVGKSKYFGCVSPAYYVIRLRNDANQIGYYSLLLNIQKIRDVYRVMGKGIMAIDRGEGKVNTCRLKVPYESFGSIRIPVPPLPEQHSIVSFLDSKCSKIDEWISKKQKEVELLGEAKQRIIADAVTRGLKPNVKMKKTGIAWLEEVPEHWELKPIRSLLKESEEKTETGDEELLSLSQYTGITRKKDANKTGMFEAETTIGYKKVHPGQFVMNIMLAWNGSYAVSTLDGIISPAYCVFDFICDCDIMYYDYLLRTKMYSSAFKTESRGIIDSRLRLYPYKFYPFYIPVPPLSEQQAIVSYITSKTTKIESLMSSMNKEIEHLKEYKQRLISDVVTGQIKVC